MNHVLPHHGLKDDTALSLLWSHGRSPRADPFQAARGDGKLHLYVMRLGDEEAAHRGPVSSGIELNMRIICRLVWDYAQWHGELLMDRMESVMTGARCGARRVPQSETRDLSIQASYFRSLHDLARGVSVREVARRCSTAVENLTFTVKHGRQDPNARNRYTVDLLCALQSHWHATRFGQYAYAVTVRAYTWAAVLQGKLAIAEALPQFVDGEMSQAECDGVEEALAMHSDAFQAGYKAAKENETWPELPPFIFPLLEPKKKPMQTVSVGRDVMAVSDDTNTSTKYSGPRAILSGGQTGADRGGLDAAMAHGRFHLGWCPKGRLAEDGVIPRKYRMTETSSPKYPPRTALNIRDSDATLIFAEGRSRGSALTAKICRNTNKHHLWIPVTVEESSGAVIFPEDIAETLRIFLGAHRPEKLNVAGSRESRVPGIQEAVRDLLLEVLRDLEKHPIKADPVSL